MIRIRYGTDSTLDLDLDDEAQVQACDAPRGVPIANVAAAAREALAAPLSFPPLAQSAVPGDKAVLAVEPGVPQAAVLVAEAAAALLAAGLAAEDITVLSISGNGVGGHSHGQVEDADADALLAALPADVRAAVELRQHDPYERDALSYLAATADALPIYINRAIHDADTVITIGTLRLPESLGYHGIHTGLFPTFSDASTRARFRSPKAMEPEEQEALRKQADEVGWLLGPRFTIQVVPGGEGAVLNVLAGDQDEVLAAGSRACEEAWRFEVPYRAGLVVAALDGDASEQTWENVGRALASAARVLNDDGDVVICSRLAELPGPGLERIMGADDLFLALREIEQDKPYDSLPAAELARSLERGKVYLVSDLPEDRVEALGIIPIGADDVSGIASRYDSVIVLPSAQFAQAWPASEPKAKKTRTRRSRS
jgi:nickel-dependent lactate racemase